MAETIKRPDGSSTVIEQTPGGANVIHYNSAGTETGRVMHYGKNAYSNAVSSYGGSSDSSAGSNDPLDDKPPQHDK